MGMTLQVLEPPSKLPLNRFRLYQEAKKIVEARIAFLIHLGAFFAVNALLFLINMATADRTGYWFIWPALLWGSAVLVHGCFVILYSRKNVRQWQEEGLRGRKAIEMMMALTFHWSLFAIINLLLLTINALTYMDSQDHSLWSIWIVLGWGIGIGFHTLWIYLNKDHKLKRWKRRKALQILERWGGL